MSSGTSKSSRSGTFGRWAETGSARPKKSTRRAITQSGNQLDGLTNQHPGSFLAISALLASSNHVIRGTHLLLGQTLTVNNRLNVGCSLTRIPEAARAEVEDLGGHLHSCK